MNKALALVTKRLLLRPITSTEVESLHRLWTDPEVRRFLWDGRTVTLEETADIVAKNIRLFQDFGFGIWGIYAHTSQQLLGFAGYWYFRTPPSLELVFGVSSDCWNRGIATEASECVIRQGFDVLKFVRVQASTDAANAASQRVLEKLRMSINRRAEVDLLDTIFYKLERDDWQKVERATPSWSYCRDHQR